MSVCILCKNDFILPKSPKTIDKLIFSIDGGEIEYMCSDCHDERANSDFRYQEGHLLCSKKGCGRNAIIFSKYCFKCDEFETL